MTENKRFTFKDGYLFDDEKGNAFLTVGDCCELLNELHEENEQLKLSNRLLLEEMREIRDRLTVYLEIRKGDFE